MDNSYGLLEVQEVNLKLLKEIERICTKYKLDYVLDAGTLLGAVRQGGFIPWDDDVDIAMTRKNWEAFKKVARRELPDGMILVLPDEYNKGKAFFDFTPRVVYEASRRRKPDKESSYYGEIINHLWVDIFILDNIPSNKILAAGMKTLQKAVYLLAMGHRYKIDYKKYSPFNKLAVLVGSKIGWLFSVRSICRMQDAFAKMLRRTPTRDLFYSNYQPDYLYVTLKREWSVNSCYIDFEDIKLKVPKEYDKVLTLVYGDYMTLPPKEKRKPPHGSDQIQIFA